MAIQQLLNTVKTKIIKKINASYPTAILEVKNFRDYFQYIAVDLVKEPNESIVLTYNRDLEMFEVVYRTELLTKKDLYTDDYIVRFSDSEQIKIDVNFRSLLIFFGCSRPLTAQVLLNQRIFTTSLDFYQELWKANRLLILDYQEIAIDGKRIDFNDEHSAFDTFFGLLEKEKGVDIKEFINI